MIITDEHNLRTLGCYREFWKSKNQAEQAHVWGEGVEVETPNIDKLASQGALFTNFYTVAPLCTPSRASFMSGMYPQKTGTEDNHGAIDDDIVTFAKALREKKNYSTAYFGKWHLNGNEKPGWGGNSRKFGFQDIHYQWNRGHWKFLDEVNGNMRSYNYDAADMFAGVEDSHYTTDFLFDRSMEFINTATTLEQPFALVLSIPDPHSPNDIREPYLSMYKDMHFNLPHTAVTAATKNPGVPDWNYHDHTDVPLDNIDAYLKEYEQNEFWQQYMQQYFGMIKCVDDNVGRLLAHLKAKDINKNTIVV